MLDNSSMSKELLIEQQNFFRFISNYEYIDKNGRLDLEAFCRYLSICFDCDRILTMSTNPRDMYLLLIDILSEKAKDENEKKLWVQTQNLIDWTPAIAHMYPDKYRTYIHAGGLLMAMTEWIFHIGHHLIGLPENEENPKYFAWVNPDWTFTFAFINGFHNYFYEYVKRFDKGLIDKNGYSHFEALSLSKRKNMGYDNAVEVLKSRNKAKQDATSRINEAISSRFFLEAITLEECLISNCIYNYLFAKKTKLTRPTFRELLECVIKKSESLKIGNVNLFVNINSWRKKRNTAIHGFITTRSDSLNQSQTAFRTDSESTALKGAEYCEQISQWYDQESVNFIEHRFEVETERTYQ